MINSEFPSAGISLPLLRDVRSDVPCIEKSRHTAPGWRSHALSAGALSLTFHILLLPEQGGLAGPTDQGFPVTFVNDAAPFQAASLRRPTEGAAEQSAAQAHREDHHVPVAPCHPYSLGIIA